MLEYGDTVLFGLLRHETCLEILEYCDPQTLLLCGTCSRVMYVICGEDSLWASIAARQGDISFKGSWKRTVLERMRSCMRPPPLIHASVYSTFFSNLSYRRRVNLTNFKPERELIHRRHYKISKQQFENNYDAPHFPVCLEGGIETWSCRKSWTLGKLASVYGPDIKWMISHSIKYVERPLQMSLQDYIVYLASQIDESPLYIFDGKFGEKAPGMLDEFDISTFGCHFENDFYSILNKRPTFRWFVAGPARTGAPWHIDPGCTSAWNALLTGHKRWAMYPPGKVPPGVSVSMGGPEGTSVESFDSPSSLSWYLDVYPNLTADQMPLEIVQNPGDVIFIPTGWWHLVLNLDDTVSVTQNFVNAFNLRSAIQDLAENQDDLLEEIAPKLISRRLMPKHVMTPYEMSMSSDCEYMQSFRDVGTWSKMLDKIFNHYQLGPPTLYLSLTKRWNPCFLEEHSQLVAKLYSPYTNSDVSGNAVVVCHDGSDLQQAETVMLQCLLTSRVSSFVYPLIFARGSYHHADSGMPWHWPYILQSKVPGDTLSNVRQHVDMSEVARWLSKAVSDIHRMDVIPKPEFDFKSFLVTQEQFALSSHWRRAVIPLVLLCSMEEFVAKHLPFLLSRPVSCYRPLHGDLQDENILVTELYPEHQEVTSFLRNALVGCESALRDKMISKIVDEECIRMNSLKALSDFDLQQIGIPMGPRILIRNAVRRLTSQSLLKPSVFIPSGIIDFGDSIFGDPLFDLIAIHVVTFKCDSELLNIFIQDYYEPSCFVGFPLAEEILTCLALLHPCDSLHIISKFKPEALQATCWEEFSKIVFNVK